MNFTAVLPWVDPIWTKECLDTCRFPVELVDNSIVNRGVSRSWNMGIDKMRADDTDWLILVSHAIRFGKPGGLDFLDLLESKPDHRAISALDTFGWHLIAFSRETVESVGRFDENFAPGYLEDIDWAIRMYRVKPDAPWGAYAIDVTDAGMAHSIAHGVEVDYSTLARYFRRKWGAQPGSEWDAYYRLPFNSERKSIGYWPPFNGAHWDEPAPERL